MKTMIENYINKVINGDCIEVMKEMPESFVDLIVTLPLWHSSFHVIVRLLFSIILALSHLLS